MLFMARANMITYTCRLAVTSSDRLEKSEEKSVKSLLLDLCKVCQDLSNVVYARVVGL